MAGREKRKRRRKQRTPARDRAAHPAAGPIGNGHDVIPRKSKDDLARERLEPLGEGERPLAVTVAAVVAAVLALANVVLLAAGVGVGDAKSNGGGVIVFAALMLLAAVGMWYARYWAVLGFQAILGLSIVSMALFLVVGADSVVSVLVASLVLAAAATLFWFLVKALARIQMPERRPPP